MDAFIQTLNEYPQFIVRKGKIPFDPTQMEAGNPHDPAMWMDAETAMATASLFGADYGIGFVLTAADPFWCIDIDHCLIDGTWSPLANEMMTLMAGCAIEVSMSGEGLHLFGKGTAPDHSMKNIPLGMEFYTELRYIALTGNPTTGDAGIDLTHILPHLVSKYFPAHAAVDAVEWTTGPCAEWSGPVNDDILIAKATGTTSAAAAFGVKTSLKQLWEGDAGGISLSYPDGERDYDASSADAALAQHLAFWTGKDCARIERLMLKSGLVRDKWTRRENGPGYLKTTILRAVAQQVSVYNAGGKAGPPGDGGDTLAALTRSTIASLGAGNVMHTRGSFWTWDDGRWSQVDDQVIRQEIHAICSKTIGDNYKKNQIDGVIDFTKTELYRSNHHFNVNPDVINLANGELHFSEKHWSLKPHNRDNYFTTQLPVAYDPFATAPRFTQ